MWGKWGLGEWSMIKGNACAYGIILQNNYERILHLMIRQYEPISGYKYKTLGIENDPREVFQHQFHV